MDEKLKNAWAWLRYKASGLWSLAQKDVGSIWSENKVFFFLFGAVILVIKFRDVLINLLVSSGKAEVKSDEKKDQKLAKEADDANKQADALVQQAQKLEEDKKPVAEDWYKNENK
jgi:hypothetical protein